MTCRAGSGDSQNVRLANLSGQFYQYGIPMAAGNYPGTFAAGTYQLYFAAASNGVPTSDPVNASSIAANNGEVTTPPDWPAAPKAWARKNPSPLLQGLQPAGPVGGPGAPIVTGSSASVAPLLTLCPPTNPKYGDPAGCPATPAPPYYVVNNAAPTVVNNGTATWNLIDGYLRVEYKDASGAWNPVTREWLGLGFARGWHRHRHWPPPAGGKTRSIRTRFCCCKSRRTARNSGTYPTFARPKDWSSPAMYPVRRDRESGGECTAVDRRAFSLGRHGGDAVGVWHFDNGIRALLPLTGIPSTSTMSAKVKFATWYRPAAARTVARPTG